MVVKRDPSPCSKVAYGTQSRAEKGLLKVQSKMLNHSSGPRPIPIRAYLCACGWWHLTSKKKRR